MPMKAMKKLEKPFNLAVASFQEFVVSMPNNGIITEKLTAKREKRMQKDWNTKLEKINDYVTARKENEIETSNVFTHLVLNGLFIRATPKLLGLAKDVIEKTAALSVSFFIFGLIFLAASCAALKSACISPMTGA